MPRISTILKKSEIENRKSEILQCPPLPVHVMNELICLGQ